MFGWALWNDIVLEEDCDESSDSRKMTVHGSRHQRPVRKALSAAFTCITPSSSFSYYTVVVLPSL